jgi:hypothetical protein
MGSIRTHEIKTVEFDKGCSRAERRSVAETAPQGRRPQA